MNKILSILLLATLVGCASAPSIVPATLNAREVRVNATLLNDCPKLLTLKEGAIMEDILEIISKNYALYAQCKDNNDALVKVVKDFSSVK